MQGEKAQLVVTDPPYGVDYTGGHGKKKRERILGDEDASLYAEALVMAHAYTDDKAPLYVWFAGNQGEDVYRAVREAHYDVAALVFWHKTKAHYGAFMAQYMQKHEPLLYCRKRGSGARWTGPTNEVTVWDADQPSRNEWHPTQKPIEVIERCIRNSSERGHIVLDLFGGSGTTLIAADNLGRAARIVELDPRYCDVIRRRYENAKGNA
jgi:DNA modification methylase